MSPESKVCQNCKQPFIIEPEDFDFYKRMEVPPPTWCPECRIRRRLVWRNERTLYKRTCTLCQKSIVAMYPSEVPFPVYCKDCWFSDKWDPLSYGRDYDFSRTFFEQLYDLFNVVPQIALQATNSVNSDYINQAANCKNCYLLTSAADVEDSFYSNRVLNSKNICDCQEVHKLENGYEASQTRDSSDIYFSNYCYSSFSMRFCYDVRNSHDCFMSYNLRNKAYVWRNEQLTEGEYRKRLREVELGSYKTLITLISEYEHMKTKCITRFSEQKNTTDCTGNVIVNAKRCHYGFSVGEVENGNNLLFIDNAKDIYDCNNGCCNMERMYEVNCCGINCSNVRFCVDAWPEVRDATYSISCRNGVHDIFGCISLQKKSYCILNKQYSKEEYEKLKELITKQMSEMPYVDSEGRIYAFGEFFPQNFSPFALNESSAHAYTPIAEEEAKKKGWRWMEVEERGEVLGIPADSLADNIQEVQSNITKEVIGCMHNGNCEDQCTKAFRIIPAELDFYKTKNIPLPRLCPNCRHYQRLKNVLVGQMHLRQCMCDYQIYKNSSVHSNHKSGKCSNSIQTVYAPDRPEIVYCEECYNNEIV